MRDRDPRALLGLPHDATRGEAQRAFRQLAKATHPDAGGDAAAFLVVAGAWADLAARLPSAPAPVPPAALSPHVLAYRPSPTRVVWAETRPAAAPARRGNGAPAPAGPDFATVLEAALARQAA